MMPASGATPMRLPLPAAMPATWVPWLQPLLQGSPAPVPQAELLMFLLPSLQRGSERLHRVCAEE